jgi:hypothetical protein
MCVPSRTVRFYLVAEGCVIACELNAATVKPGAVELFIEIPFCLLRRYFVFSRDILSFYTNYKKDIFLGKTLCMVWTYNVQMWEKILGFFLTILKIQLNAFLIYWLHLRHMSQNTMSSCSSPSQYLSYFHTKTSVDEDERD